MSLVPLPVEDHRSKYQKAESIGRFEQKEDSDERREKKKDKGITVK